jgi:hypothetical protein
VKIVTSQIAMETSWKGAEAPHGNEMKVHVKVSVRRAATHRPYQSRSFMHFVVHCIDHDALPTVSLTTRPTRPTWPSQGQDGHFRPLTADDGVTMKAAVCA